VLVSRPPHRGAALPAGLLLALVVVAGGGCKSGREGASLLCKPPECSVPTQLALMAEIQPPSGTGYVTEEVTTVQIDPETGMFTLTLPKPVALSGAVRMGAPGVALAATVVATRPSRISGRPNVYYEAAVDPETGGYSLLVSPNIDGEEYMLRASPKDPSTAPSQVRTVTATSDQIIDFDFVDPLKLPAVHGTVLDSLLNPVAGVRVQAVDGEGGTTLSTTATTDSSGAFALRLAAELPATVQLVATPPAAADPAQLLPTLTRDVDLAKLGPTNALTVNLQMPPLPAAQQISYTVEGTGPSGASMPAINASCVFTADVSDTRTGDGTKATLRVNTMTNSDGTASAYLVPSQSDVRDYTLLVTPDEASPFQPTQTTVAVGLTGGGYSGKIPLVLRPLLSGWVLGPDGKPLGNLTIVPGATQVTPTQGVQALAPTSSPSPAATDADGRFSLRVDPGTWDIGLVPPADKMLPRLWKTGIQVGNGDTDLMQIDVPTGVMVRAHVVDRDGQTVPDAGVRLYTVAEHNRDCRSDDATCLAPARLRAEASADASGWVTLILASRPD
jgi:hypothetical protein